MQGFRGFPAGAAKSTAIPNAFFSELLPIIDDLAELKVTTYCFWAVQQRDGEVRYVRGQDMREDAVLLGALSASTDLALRELDKALERATARGTLLHVVLSAASGDDHLYFINTDRGRKAITALEAGDWSPGPADQPVALIIERPNIFVLYEQNIGQLTPMMAETLKDTAATYPAEWITEAVQIAVERNIRNWKYVESILKRWWTEGKADGRKNGESRSVRADHEGNRGTAYSGYERFWDPD